MERIRKYIKARVTVEGECWLWNLTRSPDGYPMSMFRMDGKVIRYAHRLSYMGFVGPIPPNMHVDHICWVRSCCNPDHLRILPAAENLQRQRSSLKATCVHGHPLSGDNLYIRKTASGRARQCRACNAAAVRRYGARKAA